MRSGSCLLYIRCKPWSLLQPDYGADTVLRFGIEFAPEVVQADGNVKNLAWRICNAKKVLVGLAAPVKSVN